MTGRFAQFLDQERRLTILQLLIEANGEASAKAIEWALKQGSHRVGVDSTVVATDLRFLQGKNCIEIDYPAEAMIAAITKRGVSCAQGNVTIEGVAKPELGR